MNCLCECGEEIPQDAWNVGKRYVDPKHRKRASNARQWKRRAEIIAVARAQEPKDFKAAKGAASGW